MLPRTAPSRLLTAPTRPAAVVTSRQPPAAPGPGTHSARPAPSLLTITLLALNIAALALGPLVLVRPEPGTAEDLTRLAALLVVLTVLGGAVALTPAGVISRVLVSALLGGTAATALHVAAYTALGTAGRSPADFWSLVTAAVAGLVVTLWLGRSAVSGPERSSLVLGGLVPANAMAAAVLGGVFLGAGGA